MKRKDGSFQMHRGGEIDVRAVYCAVVVASLTNLCSEEDLFVGTSEWIVRYYDTVANILNNNYSKTILYYYVSLTFIPDVKLMKGDLLDSLGERHMVGTHFALQQP